MELGNLEQERKNLRLTETNLSSPTTIESLPSKNELYIQCFQETNNDDTIQQYRKIYSDQTRRFPNKSSQVANTYW